MKKFLIPGAVILVLLVSACGTQPSEPALSADNIQETAVAAAFTIVAETQAAIPTNTSLPPTETPSPTPPPTDTPLPSPTLDTLLIPTATTSSQNSTGGDPCNQALPNPIDGHPTKIRVRNMTKGTLVGSLYLNKTPFGECGYRGFNLGKNDTVTFTDLVQGCYFVAVFVNNNGGKDSKAFGSGCINNPDLWEFKVFADNVILNSP